MTKTTSFALIFALTVLPACGRFDFGSRLAQEGHIAEAKFLTLEASKALGYGVCSPIDIKAWASAKVEGAAITATSLKLAGLRASDKVFSDSNCTNQVDASALTLAAWAVSATYYVKPGAAGAISLSLSAEGDRFAGVNTDLPVATVLVGISFSGVPVNGIFNVDAGYCSSAVGVVVKDGGGMPINLPNQKIKITGGDGLIYSNNTCTSVIADSTLVYNNSASQTFYLKRNTVAGGQVTLVVQDPTNAQVSTASLKVNFNSAPYQVRLKGGPSSKRVVLGLCEATAFQVQILDVDGNLVVARTNTTVQLATTGSTLVNYRVGCSAMNPVITNLVFGPNDMQKSIVVEARSYSAIYLRAYAAGLGEDAASTKLDVDVQPMSFSVSSNPTVSNLVAGHSASFTVNLQDGLGNGMLAPGQIGFAFTANQHLPGSTFSPANPVIAPSTAGTSVSFTPGSDLPNANGVILSASVNYGGRTLTGSSPAFGIQARVPAGLAITGGTSGPVPYGVCDLNVFRVELRDNEGIPVGLQTGSMDVDLVANVSGSIAYNLDSCGGASATKLTFGVGEKSKSVVLTAKAKNSVTMKVRNMALASPIATKDITVAAPVPVSVAFTGPSSVKAGVPSAAYVVSLKDALGDPIPANQNFNISVAVPSQAAASICSAPSCSSFLGSPSLPFPKLGNSVSFYLYSGFASNNAMNLSVGVTTDIALTAPNPVSTSFQRTSLARDPNFASSGVLTGEQGQINASLFSSSRLTVAGSVANGAVRNFMVSRVNADRGVGMGTPDLSFNGGQGYLVLAIGEDSYATALAGSAGSLYVAGVSSTSGDKDIVLVRLNNGSLDQNFRVTSGAVVPLALAGNQVARAVAVGGDGSIYVVGSTDQTLSGSPADTSDFFVAVFKSNGDLHDRVQIDMGGNAETATAALVQSFGSQDRLLIGGTTEGGSLSNSDFAFARIFGLRGTPTPSELKPDNSFGNSGFASYDLGDNANDRLMGMIPVNSRVVAIGLRGNKAGVGSTIGLLGIGGSSGAKDGSFGSGGSGFSSLDVTGVNQVGYSLAYDSINNALYLAGSTDNAMVAGRLSVDGLPDGHGSSYSLTGGSSAAAYSVALGQDQKPLVSGVRSGSTTILQLLR